VACIFRPLFQVLPQQGIYNRGSYVLPPIHTIINDSIYQKSAYLKNK
jgi:hypothetical protein